MAFLVGHCSFEWLLERFIYTVTTEKSDAGGENGLHLFFVIYFFKSLKIF